MANQKKSRKTTSRPSRPWTCKHGLKSCDRCAVPSHLKPLSADEIRNAFRLPTREEDPMLHAALDAVGIEVLS